MKIRNGLNDHALVEGMDQLHIDIGTAQRRFLSHLAEFDARERYKPLGHRDTAEWLSARYGYSRHRAKRCVTAAHAIEHLPHIAQALEDGTLNLERVIELTRMATPQDEEQLISWARRVTAWHIGRRADRHDAKAARHAKRADRARFLQWWFNDDATLSLYGQLTSDQGAAFVTAIDRVLHTTPASPVEPQDPVAARRADALMTLVSQRLASDPDPDRATIVLHTTPQQLRSKTQHSELAGGISVPPTVAQRLACDARVQVVTHQPDADIDIAPTTYQVPPAMRRVVLERDHYRCTFPGCHANRVDIHHLKPWPQGPTQPHNLAAVCRVHHKLAHEHAWIARLRDGVVRWFRPDGSPYDPMPVRAGPDP